MKSLTRPRCVGACVCVLCSLHDLGSEYRLQCTLPDSGDISSGAIIFRAGLVGTVFVTVPLYLVGLTSKYGFQYEFEIEFSWQLVARMASNRVLQLHEGCA